MPCRATQDEQVMLESSDKMWSTGEGNAKPLRYSCFENPMNSMKRQKDRTLKDELPRSVGAQYATGDQFLEILVSPCLSLSLTLVESPSGARNPPSLLILPGLLRSDRGGLSVSSPLGERKDACGLRKWCKLLVLKFYWSPA